MKKELYMHLCNGGVSFIIEDTQKFDKDSILHNRNIGGPVLTVYTNSFGNLNINNRIVMSKASLKKLANMLLEAYEEIQDIEYETNLGEVIAQEVKSLK